MPLKKEKITKLKTEFHFLPFTKSHHVVVSNWWQRHGFPVLPLSSLPQNGRMIWAEDHFLAAGFLYLSDSDIAYIEWIISNPDAPAILRAKSIEPLVEELCSLAKAKGCRVVFMALENKRLIENLLKKGFMRGDVNMTHLVRGL